MLHALLTPVVVAVTIGCLFHELIWPRWKPDAKDLHLLICLCGFPALWLSSYMIYTLEATPQTTSQLVVGTVLLLSVVRPVRKRSRSTGGNK